MKVKKGEYVIVTNKSEKGNKKFLMKVKDAEDGEVSGMLEHMCHVQKLRSFVTVKNKDVVVNLGENPDHGKVHGIEVAERYHGKKTHDKFGDIHFFYDCPKDVVKDLWVAFDKVYVMLKRRELEFLLDDIVWEILPFHGGKYAGMFVHKRSKSEDPVPAQNRILLKPESNPASEFTLLIAHEIAHHLHTNFATSKKLNANWIKLFNTSIKVVSIKKEDSQKILKDLMSQQDLPSDFKGQLDEDDALIYKWILRTIQQLNGISIKELDIMFEADMKDEIQKLWPTRAISHKDLHPAITEYSCKNYRETVAEVFAYYLTGRKLPSTKHLPEPVVKLMEKTISYAKTQQVK